MPATTLQNWRNGGDATEESRAAIAANTITANKLTIGNRGIGSEEVMPFDLERHEQRDPDDPTPSRYSWPSANYVYYSDDGAILERGSTAVGFIDDWLAEGRLIWIVPDELVIPPTALTDYRIDVSGAEPAFVERAANPATVSGVAVVNIPNPSTAQLDLDFTTQLPVTGGTLDFLASSPGTHYVRIDSGVMFKQATLQVVVP